MKKIYSEALQTLLLIILLIGIYVYGNAHYRDGNDCHDKPVAMQKR